MAKRSNFNDDFSLPLKDYLNQGRVRIMDWLTVDTLPLLETGYVVASIHHGGSSSYNEAMTYELESLNSCSLRNLLTVSRASVPQVVIPTWEDHYNFAQMVWDLGLG